MTSAAAGRPAFFRRFVRKLFPPRIATYRIYKRLLRGSQGLEIGGPTKLFSKRGLVPVYPVLQSLDGCNFCAQTVWEGRIAEGPERYRYAKHRPAGRQYVSEATDLTGIGPGAYDVVLSSHCLEHVANPLRALAEWLRVLKEGGFLLLVVPHKDGTFDHLRPVTSLQHFIDDYKRSTGEDDLSHLPEILEFHDLSMDPPAGDKESFRQRSLKNFENRCLHHHVFDADLAVRMLDHLGLQVLDVQQAAPYHIITLSRKLSASDKADNSAFLGARAFLVQSPLVTARSKRNRNAAPGGDEPEKVERASTRCDAMPAGPRLRG